MEAEKTLKEKVFEACNLLQEAGEKINTQKVREYTKGSARDISRYINEWEEAKKATALTVVGSSEISPSDQESAAIEGTVPNSVPIDPVISNTEFEQIKLNAAKRVKALRLAEMEVTQAMLKNPDLLPEEIRLEIEEANMAVVSTPLSHQAYYDPNVLAQLVIQSL